VTGFVIDTNVLSELAKPAPTASVVAFLNRTADLWVSAIAFHEMAYGVARMSDDPRKARLLAFIDTFKIRFEGRIVAVDLSIAETAGRLRGLESRRGRTLSPTDSLIAATAMVHGATLATRNVRDFRELDIPLIDPWEGA
jgi:predicted nucleic acid-binding protein